MRFITRLKFIVSKKKLMPERKPEIDLEFDGILVTIRFNFYNLKEHI
jgi:hypothetical protein